MEVRPAHVEQLAATADRLAPAAEKTKARSGGGGVSRGTPGREDSARPDRCSRGGNKPRMWVMNTAKKVYESDAQGVVHVEVPVGRSRQRVEVLVVWEDAPDLDDLDQEGPSMADLVGLLQDVDLERPPQGAYEKRDPIP